MKQEKIKKSNERLGKILTKLEQLELRSSGNSNNTAQSVVSEWMLTFSGHGLEKLAKAKTKLQKFIWTVIIITSITFGCIFIITEFHEFYEYNFVTQIKVVKVLEIDFPAVTFCEHFNYEQKINIIQCKFDLKECNLTDIFEEINIFYLGTNKTCLRLNGHKLNSSRKTLVEKKYGWEFGMHLVLVFPAHLHYYVGNNTYEPVDKSLIGVVQPGGITDLALSKTVQKTLGKPYNPCIRAGETYNSEFFR